MKYLARGSICFGLLALIFTAFFYLQPVAEAAPDLTPRSEDKSETLNQTTLDQNNIKEHALNNHNNSGLTTADLTETTEYTANFGGKGGKARSFRATAYCLRGKTASGRRVRRGVVAADPRVLPLGSRIKISAGKYSGNYIVADTGGKIKGRILDIWVPSCAEARRWGRRNIKVTVLKKGKTRRSKKKRSRRRG